MTVDERQDQQEPEDQPLDENRAIPEDDTTSSDDGLDIENALASVATLSEAVAAHEADEAEYLTDAEQSDKPHYSGYTFPEPEFITLGRGQIASLVPALLLIGLGTWLTFALTTDATLPGSGTIALILSGVFGLSLITYWLASGRWSQGALFGGLSVLALSGTLFFLAESNDPGPDGWPLLIAAFGGAILLSALLSPGNRARIIAVGLILMIAGIVGFFVTTGTLDADITDTIESIGPVILIICLVILLLPGLARFRRT